MSNFTIAQEESIRANMAEQCFLGALMHDPLSFDKIEDVVSDDDFSSKHNKAWFAQIKKMVQAGTPVEWQNLVEELYDQNPKYNWLIHVTDAMHSAPSAANIRHHALVVSKHARERATMIAASSISDALSSRHLDHSARVMAAEAMLQDIASQSAVGVKTTYSIQEALVSAVEETETKYQQDDSVIEFSYSIDGLDEMTLGAHRGDLIYIAGRPSMGKTALAMNFAESFCRAGHVGVIKSMEMTAIQLAGRMITGVGQIDAQRYRKGDLIDDDWNKLTYALSKINDFKLEIDESPIVNPASIRKSARAAIKKHGRLDFIVVDYLQLMTTDSPSNGTNRTGEITEISRQLKQIAKEFNVPVFALSQLNRNLEQRPNKRPVMSDLRESGAIEQDGDVILFIYRDEVYNADTEYKGVAEIIIGKQRNGPIGVAMAAYIGSYSKFTNLTNFNVANRHDEY